MPEAISSVQSAAPVANRSMAIVYGSETGNSEEVAKELGKMAERLYFETVVDEMNRFSLRDLLHFSLVIFVTSTTGQGDMPGNASELWRSLLRRKLPPNCLGSLRFTVFGLGDSSYPKFNWAARKLHRRLSQLGATEFFRPGEGDERHDNGIDSIFIVWAQELREALLSKYPLPEAMEPIADDVQLPPRMVLRLASTVDGHVTTKPLLPQKESQAATELPPDKMLPIPNAFTAHVVTNDRVTPPDHFQDVRFLTFAISQEDNEPPIPELSPGSTLIIYPKNYAGDVQRLIDLMGWDDLADRPLERVPYTKRPSSPAFASLSEAVRQRFAGMPKLHAWEGATLRDLLTHNFDISAIPTRTFVRELAAFTPSERERERLVELAALGNSQDFYDYTWRPRRTIVELLHDFPRVRIPFERTVDLFPLIRGREFSIANSGAALRPADGRLTLEVLAAMVEYRTIIRKPRQGLCSRYLRHLPAGAVVRVGLKASASTSAPGPASGLGVWAPSRPLVAIATGTGIAPIRSLLQTRGAGAGPALLFFGCRGAGADFYFADEWARTPGLRVVAAFSRDPAAAQEEKGRKKSYVQDQIRRHAREVARLVGAGALVCLCGSSGRMPLAVKEALLDALVEGGLVGSRQEADGFWPRIAFWQETW